MVRSPESSCWFRWRPCWEEAKTDTWHQGAAIAATRCLLCRALWTRSSTVLNSPPYLWVGKKAGRKQPYGSLPFLQLHFQAALQLLVKSGAKLHTSCWRAELRHWAPAVPSGRGNAQCPAELGGLPGAGMWLLQGRCIALYPGGGRKHVIIATEAARRKTRLPFSIEGNRCLVDL